MPLDAKKKTSARHKNTRIRVFSHFVFGLFKKTLVSNFSTAVTSTKQKQSLIGFRIYFLAGLKHQVFDPLSIMRIAVNLNSTVMDAQRIV